MHDSDLNLTIAQVIKKYELFSNKKRSKSFGQHFLCDSSLLNKIVSCALPFEPDVDVIEVGPGPCGLTREIAKLASKSKIYCIEKDTELQPLHDNFATHAAADVTFIYKDALKVKPQELTDKEFIIISNLPYNVGTQLFLNWLSDLTRIQRMVLMFQKEVADRICAQPGSKKYGRLSVISQLLCHTEKLFDVSNGAFFPPPKVMSTVIKVTPKHVQIEGIEALEKLTEKCFQTRRKTLFSILRKAYPDCDIESILDSCGLDKQIRPENISSEKFLELARRLS